MRLTFWEINKACVVVEAPLNNFFGNDKEEKVDCATTIHTHSSSAFVSVSDPD